jgi:hypothetical protein
MPKATPETLEQVGDDEHAGHRWMPKATPETPELAKDAVQQNLGGDLEELVQCSLPDRIPQKEMPSGW